MRLAVAALIFDFDGVIADSEALANTVLAEFVSNLGQPTTLDDALERYCGRRWDDVLAAIESAVGRPLPADFSDDLKVATLDRFRRDLREVGGATGFIRAYSDIPRCIASSSSVDRCSSACRFSTFRTVSEPTSSAPTWSGVASRTPIYSCSQPGNSGSIRNLAS